MLVSCRRLFMARSLNTAVGNNRKCVRNRGNIAIEIEGAPRFKQKHDYLRRRFSAIGDVGGGDGGAGGGSSRRTSRRAGGGGASVGAGAAKTEGSEAVTAAQRDTAAATPLVELNRKHEHDGVGDMAVGPDEGLPIS